ncbi:MAG: 50S ribosomal protein L11 methyltransferase [Gemmatimonadota bacterium]
MTADARRARGRIPDDTGAARSGVRTLPDRWLELAMPAGRPGETPLLVDALRRVGARAVERDGDRVIALFPPPADPAALLAEAASAIRASTSETEPRLASEWRSHEEWAAAWRTNHPPERVVGRLVVAPTGSAWQGRDDDLVIRLDPAVAFGTAEHPTTRACLRMLATHLSPDDRVLDVGAGSGSLAIAAALLGASRVLALEADPLACAAARENAYASGVADRIEVGERRVEPRDFRQLWPPGRARLVRWFRPRDDARLHRRAPFHVILANLDAETVVRLLPGFRRVLAPAGWLVLSGVVRVERAAVLEAAAGEGLALSHEEMEGGWWTARLTAGEQLVVQPPGAT